MKITANSISVRSLLYSQAKQLMKIFNKLAKNIILETTTIIMAIYILVFYIMIHTFT
jgi:hypothetical protein